MSSNTTNIESVQQEHRVFPPAPEFAAKAHIKSMAELEALRAEAKTCSKARLKEIYQLVADEIMATIAKLVPCEDKKSFP
jgi:hypothetical protein